MQIQIEHFYKKFQKANFRLYYYLFYDYNAGKISSIIYDTLNFCQLLSINMNKNVKFFYYNRLLNFGKIIQQYSTK
jgi:hypothetical protein